MKLKALQGVCLLLITTSWGTLVRADWHETSITELQAAMAAGELTSVQLTQHYLERIDRYDQQGVALNAVMHLNQEALEQARAMDAERRSKGPRSPLHGIPLVVKDNYETIEMPTTAGSQLFAGFHPKRDAQLVASLKQAGAIIIAKTTMHEFAYGITTVGSAFGETNNPYNPERNAGGSSGGTGAAVAAGYAAAGMGSDTCGSIRIPAAQNNLVGIRSSQDLLSQSGIVPLSSTQDVGGPIARSVPDLAIMMDALVAHHDESALDSGAKGFSENLATMPDARIGLLSDYLVTEASDQPVADVINQALQIMAASQQWQVTDIASPKVNDAINRDWNGHVVLIYDFAHDINAYLAANPSIGISDLADLIGRDQHHRDIHDSLVASQAIAQESELYAAELNQRAIVRAALTDLMQAHNLHALAYPTIRWVAQPHGEAQMGTNCRIAANSGFPAISVPVGFSVDGMPVGLELLASSGQEQLLMDLAHTVEQTIQARRAPELERAD